MYDKIKVKKILRKTEGLCPEYSELERFYALTMPLQTLIANKEKRALRLRLLLQYSAGLYLSMQDRQFVLRFKDKLQAMLRKCQETVQDALSNVKDAPVQQNMHTTITAYKPVIIPMPDGSKKLIYVSQEIPVSDQIKVVENLLQQGATIVELPNTPPVSVSQNRENETSHEKSIPKTADENDEKSVTSDAPPLPPVSQEKSTPTTTYPVRQEQQEQIGKNKKDDITFADDNIVINTPTFPDFSFSDLSETELKQLFSSPAPEYISRISSVLKNYEVGSFNLLVKLLNIKYKKLYSFPPIQGLYIAFSYSLSDLKQAQDTFKKALFLLRLYAQHLTGIFVSEEDKVEYQKLKPLLKEAKEEILSEILGYVAKYYNPDV